MGTVLSVKCELIRGKSPLQMTYTKNCLIDLIPKQTKIKTVDFSIFKEVTL
jgi:hypothetical protein